MKYNDALNLAKKIMEKRPQLILCGSVGLILQKAIPERDIHDLDFACLPEDFTFVSELSLYGGAKTDYNTVENEDNTCYKVVGDSGYYYDVFVFDDSEKLEYSIVNGIKVQSVNQILSYKKVFDRPKDRNDLQAWEPFGGINPNLENDDEIPF